MRPPPWRFSALGPGFLLTPNCRQLPSLLPIPRGGAMSVERRRSARLAFVAAAEIIGDEENTRSSSQASELSLHGCCVFSGGYKRDQRDLPRRGFSRGPGDRGVFDSAKGYGSGPDDYGT